MTATDVAAATTPQISAAPATDTAAVAAIPAQALPPGSLPSAPLPSIPASRRRRIAGMSIWGVLFLIGWLTIGIPTDPVEAFVWIWTATIAWNNDKPWRTHLRF